MLGNLGKKGHFWVAVMGVLAFVFLFIYFYLNVYLNDEGLARRSSANVLSVSALDSSSTKVLDVDSPMLSSEFIETPNISSEAQLLEETVMTLPVKAVNFKSSLEAPQLIDADLALRSQYKREQILDLHRQFSIPVQSARGQNGSNLSADLQRQKLLAYYSNHIERHLSPQRTLELATRLGLNESAMSDFRLMIERESQNSFSPQAQLGTEADMRALRENKNSKEWVRGLVRRKAFLAHMISKKLVEHRLQASVRTIRKTG